MNLSEMILSSDADITAIASYLDGLDHDERVTQSRSLGAKPQRRLWDLARGRAVSLDDIVPADRGPLETVRHYGRNTLPAFTLFEKRFCRPPESADTSVLWGYNEGTARPVVGPGYFVCRTTDGDSRGETVVDYYQVPPGKPATWPAVRSNETGIQRFVYGFMHDFLRRVSTHVTIGRAYKLDRETPNCFTLCREP
jgi:hypothetical protein